MQDQIVPQNEKDVNSDVEECNVEGCCEYIYRDGLCLFHYTEEETAAWDDHDADRQMTLGTIGHIVFFGDPVEVLA